jgi:hypothetical protein
MAGCDLSNGRLESCKDTIGGIDAVYFVNFGDYTYPTDVTETNDVITAVAGVANLYKYELKGTNSFDQVVNSSRENGTTFVEQTLTMTLKKQDATTHKSVKLLAYGRPHVIIRNRNAQYFLAGLEHGMELTTANVANGVQMADLNGYTLTFVGQEKLLANIIDVDTEAQLQAAFGNAQLVTI